MRPLLFLTACCIAVAANAFDFIGTPPIRWAVSEVPMILQLDDSAFDDSTSWDAVAAEALDSWNSVLTGFQFVADSGSGHSDGNDRNEVFFSPYVYGHRFGQNVLAITTIWRSGKTTRVEGDTIFNTDIDWDVYNGDLRSDDVVDFRRVATHEFGHTVGLDHPDEAGQVVPALMNSIVSDLYWLTDDDVRGAQGLYPAPGTRFEVAAIAEPANSGTVLISPSSPDGKYAPGTLVTVTVRPSKGYRLNYWEGAETAKGKKYKFVVYTDTAIVAHFTPTSSPRIVRPPQNQFVDPGYDALLRVTASAGSGATYQWQHNGVDLPSETYPILFLENLHHDDSGLYTVVVRNARGETTSKPARLVVGGY